MHTLLRVSVPALFGMLAFGVLAPFASAAVDQTITFDAIGNKTYGDIDFSVSATSDSGLTVTFASQAESVCTVTDTTVHIVSAGTCTIRASQPGDIDNYNAALDVDQSFAVDQAPLTIVANDYSKTYGDANPFFDAVVTGDVNGDTIDYTLETLATDFSDVGEYAISVSVGSNPNYSVTPTDGALTVAALPITITADAISKVYGDPDPEFTYEITSGAVVNGDTFAGSLSRDAGEDVGEYAITSTLSNSNYDITYEEDIFTITQATSTTVISCPSSVVYTGSAHTPCSATYTTSDGLSGAAVLNYSNNISVDYALVSASYDGDANHASSAASDGFHVTKADAVINVSGFTGTYDGLSHGATGTAVGVESSPVDLSSYLHLGSSFTNVPGGTANWTFDVSRNYKAASGSVSIVINIDTSASSTLLTTSTNLDGTKSATIANSASLPLTTSFGRVAVDLPAGITVTGPAGWDGTLDMPTITTSYTSPTPPEGVLNTMRLAIEVGSSTAPLTFDKGVRLLFPGEEGFRIGWSRNGAFTEITARCSADTQAVGDALPAGGDCFISVGRDLVVWTKHFTSFITFNARTSNGSTGGGGGGVSGGGGGGGSTVTTTATSTTSASVLPLQGQVLGAATYNFTKNLSLGARGPDVTALQQFLIAGGYHLPSGVTGYFGGETKAAVAAFQRARGIAPVGSVGPLTRFELNKGSMAVLPNSNQIASVASGLTSAQVSAILGLLQAFGADAGTIATVRAVLGY